MALIFDLFFSHGTGVALMTQNKVVEIFLVINLIDNLVEALRSNGRMFPQRTNRQALPEQQFLIERRWRPLEVARQAAYHLTYRTSAVVV